jgi:hypothetical protein
MERPYPDIEAAQRSLSMSCSRLDRAEHAFRVAQSVNHVTENKVVRRFFSGASGKSRIEKRFALLAAAVAEFQHRYHEFDESCVAHGIGLKDYDWNNSLLHATFLRLEDYLSVDSESALWGVLERRATSART